MLKRIQDINVTSNWYSFILQVALGVLYISCLSSEKWLIFVYLLLSLLAIFTNDINLSLFVVLFLSCLIAMFRGLDETLSKPDLTCSVIIIHDLLQSKINYVTLLFVLFIVISLFINTQITSITLHSKYSLIILICTLVHVYKVDDSLLKKWTILSLLIYFLLWIFVKFYFQDNVLVQQFLFVANFLMSICLVV